MGEISEVAQAIREAERIVVFTGAGISAESGVPTFRGKDGLWKQYRPEELATPQAFARDPKLVWEWYNWRRELIAPLEPNDGHRFVAALEKICPDLVVVTQNIDGLHKKAGSTRIEEVHGNIWKVRCTQEGTITENTQVPLPEIPPRCPRCGALLRPNVVWFGEALPQDVWARALQAASNADLMLVIGTSAVVYPAAGLPENTLAAGGRVVEINPDATPLSGAVTWSLRMGAGEAGRALAEEIGLGL